MNIRHDERGQSMVVVVVFMTGLLAMAAGVLDVGSWYRAHRAAQATADAAALSGAQALPDDQVAARTLATQYASKNGGGLAPADVMFSTTGAVADDTVQVTVRRTAPGIFSGVLGILNVSVTAHAAARSDPTGQALYVVPIVVNRKHPLVGGTKGCPCFGTSTTLPLGKTGAPGAFTMLNLDPSDNSTAGSSTLADWILNGLDRYLELGKYYSDSGAKFNSSEVQGALRQRLNTELLFPVYDVINGQGANAKYRIIGWIGFHLTGVYADGVSGSLSGWFTRYIAQGIQATKIGGSGVDYFGTRTVQLID